MKITSVFLFTFLLHLNFLHAQSTLDSIQGDWTCIISIADMSLLSTDESYPNDEKGLTPWGNIRIEKNQLNYFDYPCEFLYTTNIESDTGTLSFTKTDDRYLDKYYLEYLNDTLTVRYYMNNSRTIYVRDKLENTIISQLKEDSIYPQSLINTWYLRKGYDSSYDGLGYVMFEFPYKLPDSLVITKSNLTSFSISKRKIYLSVNGVKRSFRITRFSLDEGILQLTEVGKWYVRNKVKKPYYQLSYELIREDEWK